MTTQQIICIAIFLITLVFYMSNKFPLPLVSMTSMVALTITGCLSPESALSVFSNSSAIIMGSMFIIAGGLNRTQMVHKVTNLVYKVSGGSFTKGMIGYCIATLLIAQVAPSAILIFSICYPLVIDFCHKMKVSPSKAIFSIGLISIATVTAFPLGSGATTYIANNTLFATYGLNYESGMFDAFIVRIPILIIAVLLGAFVCPKFADDKGPLVDEAERKKLAERPPLDPVREFLGYGIFIAVVIGILLSSYIGVDTWIVCIVGALLVILTGVLSEKEAMQALSMPPIFLFVASLGIGNALVATGAGDLISGVVTSILGENPSHLFVYTVFWLVGFVVTQFMSNMALYQTLVPVALLTCAAYNWNPIGLVNMLFAACWVSYLTPFSTVAVPLMMSVGGYTQKDLLKIGWLPALVTTAVMIPWCYFMFPL